MPDREAIRLPTVSIAIATLNGARFIEDCLRSVRRQTYPPEKVEIIVADGGSTDGTPSICRTYGAELVENPNRTEKGFQGGKSRAIRAARNEIVLLLDQDNQMAHSDFLQTMLRPFTENSRVVAVLPIVTGSPDWPAFERYAGTVYDPFTYRWTLSCEERTLLSAGSAEPYLPLLCRPGEKTYFTNGTAVRRETILSVGGYDFDLETGMRIRTKGEVWLSTRSEIYHRTATSLRELARKKAYQVREWEKERSRRAGPVGLIEVTYPRDSEEFLRLIYHAIGNLTFETAIARALKDVSRTGDSAMLWHILAAPLITAVYLLVPLSTSEGRRAVREVVGHAI